MARYIALTCEALARPVYAAAATSPHTVSVRLLKQGLHNRPKSLRRTLQEEIEAITADQCDAVLLAYGIGRIGCQVSGDGDWGVANTAPTPSWLPQWMWSYDYPNNVNGVTGYNSLGGYEGVPITDGTCFEGYCTHLVPGVYPTPFYEAVACILLFGVLWSLRKRITAPGVIFSLFLVFDGVERFLVEKIRVNEPWLGSWTQAEVISLLLTLGGLVGIWWFQRARPHGPEATH